MVGHQAPNATGIDDKGNRFLFERAVKKDSGGQGFADVFYEGHFAIEYKGAGKYKDLSEAYQQLLQYRERLNNPPLLIVTDIDNWEIHTNWPNTEKQVYAFSNDEIATRPSVAQWLRDIFYAPSKLHPRRNTEQVTTDAAAVFRLIADNMRNWKANPDRIARFLTKIVFCLFAEDIGLLPTGPGGETGIFSEIVERTRTEPSKFIRYTSQLFEAMADGGEVLFQDIPYFNGLLFEDIEVEELSYESLLSLDKASKLNWASVEPAIFGTLFERSLDPRKRAQLGAHYTSREDILLIVEPVLMQPLRRQWETIKEKSKPIREKFEQALKGSNRRAINNYGKQLLRLRQEMQEGLRTIKVLDPACGSGNFLYVSLQLLMDMEKEVLNHPLFTDLDKGFPEVHPRQMFGIELNPIAHALASIVVWIGYIQWRNQNGYVGFGEPILEPLDENIILMDAILGYDVEGNPIEPEWQNVDIIVSNPPFLGAKKMRRELGDEYVDTLRGLYANRLQGFTDFVTYWFERARSELENGHVKRVGLLATNSIGMGTNIPTLRAIKQSGDIFMAWSDRPWILDGAAVRVSMIGFDDGSEQTRMLDGLPVPTINADLTHLSDITLAKSLGENRDISFIGVQKSGPFDISASLAHDWLSATNSGSVSNSDVLRPYYNAVDITRRTRDVWIIDFGTHTTLEEAEQFLLPFKYVKTHVFPMRMKVRRAAHRNRWWIHGDARPAMRKKIAKLSRYIATPLVSKHRIFVWLDSHILPANLLIIIAREDDYFFGVLHSRLHEIWSLSMGTSLEDRPRYTPTTTFETFPFPWVPGQEDVESHLYQEISSTAKRLNKEREAWLNPSGLSQKKVAERTLTNLYNALNVFRGIETIKTKQAAADFAPRLAVLHDDLDRAVCKAYGWDHEILSDEEEILRHLLLLNSDRAS